MYKGGAECSESGALELAPGSWDIQRFDLSLRSKPLCAKRYAHFRQQSTVTALQTRTTQVCRAGENAPTTRASPGGDQHAVRSRKEGPETVGGVEP